MRTHLVDKAVRFLHTHGQIMIRLTPVLLVDQCHSFSLAAQR